MLKKNVSKKNIFYLIFFVFLLLNFSCISKEDKNNIENTLKNVSIKFKSDFDKIPSLPGSANNTVPFSDPDQYPDAFITPSEYSVAFKRVSLIKEDGNKIELFNTTKLSYSKKIDFINDNAEQILGINSIPEDNYLGFEFEIYYLQMKFPINNVEKRIRIYLSDDEVSGEGQHHQGDLTIVNDNNQEIGWFEAPDNFDGVTPRPVTTGYASGLDPQTGHDRGPFGDAKFWNTDHPEDIFVYKAYTNFSTVNVKVIKIVFNVKDTFFYDDVDGNEIFSPGANPNDDANDIGKDWAPLFPGIEIIAE